MTHMDNALRERDRALRKRDKALRESVEALLGRLPILDDRRDQIASQAEGLCLAATFASMNDLPRARKVGGKATRHELDKLAELSIALGSHILSMHRDSLDAILQQGAARHPLIIADDLRKLIAAVRQGEKVLLEIPARRDQHAKRGARDLTRYAEGLFKRLTGRPVTRTSKSVPVNAHEHGSKEDGEFHQFLAEVFKLFDVDAKAAGQIKMLKAEKAQRKKPT
jgi:hypothetical protein